MFYERLPVEMQNQLAEDNYSTVGELTARPDKIAQRRRQTVHTVVDMEEDVAVVAAATTQPKKDQGRGWKNSRK